MFPERSVHRSDNANRHRVKNHNSDIILIFPHLRRNKGPFAVQTWLFPAGVSANENFHFVTRRALSPSNSWNTPAEKRRGKPVKPLSSRFSQLVSIIVIGHRDSEKRFPRSDLLRKIFIDLRRSVYRSDEINKYTDDGTLLYLL